MALKDIFIDGAGLFIIIATIVQIAPIKVNPWTAILHAIGHLLNGEVMDEIKESEARTSRYRIIRFDDEIMMGHMHTKEHFEQILEDIDRYERFCDAHPRFPNNKAIGAIDNIKQTYKKCKYKHSFLIPQRKDDEDD